MPACRSAIRRAVCVWALARPHGAFVRVCVCCVPWPCPGHLHAGDCESCVSTAAVHMAHTPPLCGREPRTCAPRVSPFVQELDDAARRRLSKRLYIPLPNAEARLQLLRIVLDREHHGLTQADIAKVVQKADGMSGADMKLLCGEAALGPMRDVKDIRHCDESAVRPISPADFARAFKQVRASVAPKDLQQFVDWNEQFGSFDFRETELGEGDDEEL